MQNNHFTTYYIRNMDVAARLISFKEMTGLSNSQFADKAGIPRPTLSQFLNGRNKRLSDDLTAKLHAAFPSLNVMWLLFGEGDMLTDSNIQFSEGKKASLFDDSGIQKADNKPDSADVKSAESCMDSESIQKESTPEPEITRQEPTLRVTSDPLKQIQSIMVFYTDNSFEIFTPSK